MSLKALLGHKYESSFFADYKYWIRYMKDGESHITSDFPQLWEAFVPAEQSEESVQDIITGDYYQPVYLKGSEAKSLASPISPARVEARKYPEYNNSPRAFYFDIETRVGTVSSGFPEPSKALEPIALIQFMDSWTKEIYIIGCQEFYFKEQYLKDCSYNVNYIQVETEKDLMLTFFKYLEELKPLIVYAWNGDNFDFPYIRNRAVRLGIEPALMSPFYKSFRNRKEVVKYEERYNEVNRYMEYNITVPGIHYIDLMKVYKKYILKPRSSYSLQAIAEVELNSSKLDHSEFKTFDDFYLGNYQIPARPTEEQKQTLCYKLASKFGENHQYVKQAGHGQFIFYGVIDTILLNELDSKLELTNLIMSIAERMKSNLSDVLGTTKVWENYITSVLLDRNQIIVPKQYLDKAIIGGYVRTPVNGKQKWVLSADVNSMYPMLAMVGSNMSPETFRSLEDVPPDLQAFCKTHLKTCTSDEQDEGNMIAVMSDNNLKAELKAMLERENLALAPNGTFYDRSVKGFIPTLIESIYYERKKTKKEMFRCEQKVIDIESILSSRGV